MYIYKCARVCWNSNSNTLNFLWISNAQVARQQPFEFIHNNTYCDMNIQEIQSVAV